jgi:hypothetical protein
MKHRDEETAPSKPIEKQLSPLQYEPPAAGRIRILTIAPGQRPAPVVISVEAAALAPEASYSALSYTWGDASGKNCISCINAADPPELSGLQVTRNCQNALLRLRSAVTQRRFWIDAICINQSDLGERSAQVPQMAQIYKHAQSVYIYIIEEDTIIPGNSGLTGSGPPSNTCSTDKRAGSGILLH